MPPCPFHKTAGTLVAGFFGSLLGYQPQLADHLGNQHPPVGQESNLPWQIEGRHLNHVERQGRLRPGEELRCCVGLQVYRTRREHDQRHGKRDNDPQSNLQESCDRGLGGSAIDFD
jgi:hypothetical protein